jgi:5-methylcytosine-specific restriction endonuclease McrA
MSGERLLQRPIYGGVFGDGQYALASMPCVARGLYATRYMVVQPQAGVVLSVAEGKVEALALARERLNAANDSGGQNGAHSPTQFELWPGELSLEPQPAPAHYVSRRRREIFERSQGKCHYCSTPLDLTGKWHIEHQMPRALGGGDEGLNLVAACVRCNLAKSDSTAIEFVTQGPRNAQEL